MNQSRLYSFLDNKNGFTLHFLEGQQLIHDLAISRSLTGPAFNYYRNTILSVMPMISFLKHGESFGFYIDSDEPYFRFKLEANFQGDYRTLILPESFGDFPDKLNGIGRFVKIFPKSTPYSSIININNIDTHDVINKVLEESYQTDAECLLASSTDQSLFIVKLPKPEGLKGQENDLGLKEYLLQKKHFFNDSLNKNLQDIESIVKNFEDDDYAYMVSKEINFNCPCSKERMRMGLKNLHSYDLDELFEEKETIETKCDYCYATYEFTKEDLAT
jgi:molecular chaperone Hsp33